MIDRTDKTPRRAKAGSAKPDEALDAPSAHEEQGAGEPVRLAKMMARAGLCSRRDAEAWIRAGRVAVNGKLVETPAINVGPDDRVTVDGHVVAAAERTRLFLFHKPRGLVTTAKDPEGRATIFDALPEDLPRLVTIGRLDINTEGLLLLTNDGGLARALELPATGWLRRYRVRANGSIDQAQLDALAQGITVDGIDYQGIEAKLDRVQGANVWLTMGLREGKNREIKRVLEHLGLSVNRLIRLSFGPFALGDLDEGAVEEVKTRVLRDQLGADLAQKAGVDFEGPATAAVVTREVQSAKAQERRDQRAREEAPRSRRSPSTPPPDARRHVTSLRAGAAAEAKLGPRRKTEQSATADRRGRPVTVERVTVASRRPAAGEPNRNARRFDRERADAEGRPVRPRPRRDDRQTPASEPGRRPSRSRTDESRPERPARGDRPMRRPRSDRPDRDAEARSGGRPAAPRTPRNTRDGEAASPRPPRGDRPRPERARTAERPPRDGDREPNVAGRAERPARQPRHGDQQGAARPRPPRSAAPRSGPPRSGPPRGPRPGGSGGGKPRPPGSGGRGRRPS